MSWTQRIIEVTGAQPDAQEIDWASAEAQLGLSLPGDYRELCSLFGDSLYSGYLEVLQPYADLPDMGLLSWWGRLAKRTAERPSFAEQFEPYELYVGPARAGLLQWGTDQTEGEYYWLADAGVEPLHWPVVARKDGDFPWHRYDISLAEFVYRMLTDHNFKPFSIAHTTTTPFILPPGVFVTDLTDEEWNALAHRNG